MSDNRNDQTSPQQKEKRVSPIEVRAPTTMGEDFAAQFARARQLRSKKAADGGSAPGGNSETALPVPVVSLKDFKKAQTRLGDDGKDEEQAMVYGHQGGAAPPGKAVSNSLDTFFLRCEHGMVDVEEPVDQMKTDVILTETTESEPPQ